MRKARFCIVALASVLCGIAVPQSSAAVFALTNTACSGGTVVAWCYFGTNPKGERASWEFLGKQSVTMAGGTVVLSIQEEPEQKIECASSSGSGEITQNSPLPSGLATIGFKLAYTGCGLVTEPKKKCVINSTIETVQLTGEFESETEIVIKPTSGTVFFTYIESNNGSEKCPTTDLGEHSISGVIQAEILKPGTPEETKTIKTFGNTLEFFGDKASIAQQLTITFTGLGDKVYMSKIS